METWKDATQTILLTLVSLVIFVGTRHATAIQASVDLELQDPSLALIGLYAYRPFHANDSLIAESIPCTENEKICFRYNLLYDPNTRKCRALGELVGECRMRVKEHVFENGTRRISSVCQPDDFCPGYRMAYDGLCYRKEVVRDVICGCEEEPTQHFLGGAECRCTPARYLHVIQPKSKRRCRIPDLRFPDNERFLAPIPSVAAADAKRNAQRENRGACPRKQRMCFSQKKVWVERALACFPLLKRGPCPKGYVVAMTGNGWETACVDTRRGCRSGYTRLRYDQLCHSNPELHIAVPGEIKLGLYGEYEIWSGQTILRFIPKVIDGNCDISLKVTSRPSVMSSLCGSNSKREYSTEVKVGPPKPIP